MIRPGPDIVARLAEGGKRVPVYAEILADLETPTSAYWKLSHDRECSFLLESVTGGERLGRYSFIGVDPIRVLRSKSSENPLEDIKAALTDRPYAPVEGLPPFTGGAVGILAYDLVRHFERLPDDNPDELECDDASVLICDTVVAFDHAKNRILVIAHAVDGGDSYREAGRRIGEIVERLRGQLPQMPRSPKCDVSFASNMSRDAYETAVRKTIDYIEAGEGVQMVISRRYSGAVRSHPISIYRCLRYLNPSPYMFLIRLGWCDIIGASPEVLVTEQADTARVRPIAGTRPRGESEVEDERLERELLSDEKERAEHIMLVDLGRNDIGRIAVSGSVRVGELMTVEKYSHVMHIVSDVVGKIRPDLDCYDVLRACFPAGTVSGAPKVRAMEIIDELESSRRGLYAGAVGYFGYDGDMDMAIAIRTIFLKDGVAHVQAGAGIVFDSVPETEWQECENKAEGVIRAVRMAEAGELP
ncbi:MAG TPA: anthranilate synthase component I [Fimbriimonadales bacterium]|jgi:anthranilate synthase component 1|nr:anthranilate synthase component I [Fimbriimonadales bacterium]